MFIFLQSLIKQHSLILTLAKRDYQQQNKGSILGTFWNYLQPLIFVGILLLIFGSELRDVDNHNPWPFSVYLITGIVPWLFFSNTLSGTTSIIKSYNFLVKKVDFELAVLPIVKILAACPIHGILMAIAASIVAYSYQVPAIYIIQLLYYFFALLMLLLGLGWLTSSLNLFFKDVSNVVAVVTQFGFWLTPIFWDINTFPHHIQNILKLNPMYYIVNGYRESLFMNQWFWQKPLETLIFWSFTLIIFFVGFIVFKKLQPHFPEVV